MLMSQGGSGIDAPIQLGMQVSTLTRCYCRNTNVRSIGLLSCRAGGCGTLGSYHALALLGSGRCGSCIRAISMASDGLLDLRLACRLHNGSGRSHEACLHDSKHPAQAWLDAARAEVCKGSCMKSLQLHACSS